MRNKFSASVLLTSLILIGLALLLADPFEWTMNNMALILISGLLFACFAGFIGLLWREKPTDEREVQLLDKASKLAYISGLTILIIAIIVQSFDHDVDVWLVLTLSVMILSKHFYLQIKK